MSREAHHDPESHLPLSANDFHLLMELVQGQQYGYAIMKAIADSSGGLLRPEIGSLYRMIARLVGEGLVRECGEGGVAAARAAPGRPRRYYCITGLGREVFAAETRRLHGLLGLVQARELTDADPAA